MAKDKKTVVVYTDWIEKFEELTDEEAGRLIKHFFRYVNDQEPEAPDRTTKLMFIDIKNTLKRDLNKYEDKLDKRSEAGILGNLKRYNKDLYDIIQKGNMTIKEAQDLAKARKGVQDLAKLADSDSVSDSVSDNVNDIIVIEDLPIFEQPKLNDLTEEVFLKRWCDARTHYDKLPTNIKKLTTYERIDFTELRRDYVLRDFERAMQGMFQQKTYLKTRLRPSHFLKRDNFETYLTCFTTKEKLFDDNKYKKPIDRI